MSSLAAPALSTDSSLTTSVPARDAKMLALSLTLATLVSAVVIRLQSSDLFTESFAIEDGPVEWMTALFLAATAAVFLWRLRAEKVLGAGKLVMAMTALYAAAYIFAAGEEISWGQRLFDIESTAFFVENNYQAELNLHNLVIGGVHLTETLFGPALSLAILLYLLALPPLWDRSARVRAICDRLAFPVPYLSHGLIGLAATVVVGLLDAGRQWEVYELVFGVLAFSIALSPKNADFRAPL